MADIIDFGDFAPDTDIYSMDRSQLEKYLGRVRGRIDELDDREPPDMDSEEYESWADEHEQLEDLADEIMELLDEI